jgi:hypothetical protein
MSSDEKKRLEQFLLQSRASNIITVDPRFTGFQPEQIDTIRLRAAQREAGKKPGSVAKGDPTLRVSEKVIKQQLKKKRKARRGKQLRGEVSRAIREQKRFERGERRDKPEDEPRIIGEPRNTGLSYDPDIERRRLDIMEQQLRDANFRALADRRAAANRQEQELAVRRGELAAGRAERRLERERLAAVPPPAPIVIPPAPAPDIRVEAPRIEGPLVAGPLVADPIPEIQRLSRQIRADYNAFGQEQRERNEDVLRQVREQTEAQQAQAADIRQRQLETDETIRQAIQRQDAVNQEIQERIGMGETAMGEARDAVVDEIRAAENRLRGAAEELDRPTTYDQVILRAAEDEIDDDRRTIQIEEVESPTPSPSLARPSTPVTPEPREPEPEEPTGIAGVIEGGGPLELPNVVIERPGNIGPDESLRLSPEDPTQRPGAERTEIGPGGQPVTIRTLPGTAGPTEKLAGGAGPLRGEAEPELSPLEPVDVAETLRLSRLALEEAEPSLQLEEEDEAEQARLRLVDSQDFLSGFDRPETPTRSQRAARTTPVREEVIESRTEPLGGSLAVATPTPEVETPSTPEEEALLEELRAVDEQPLQPVAQGIAQFGGAAQPAPPRVIEDAGVQSEPERELRPLDPDVLLEPIEEAEEVGQVQDQRAQRIRDSQTTYQDSFGQLAGEVRTGPRGKRGQKGGLGYRVRNNTDRTLKKIQPGDVVNVIGVEEGARGEGRYRLDTQTQAGTRVSLDEFGPLVDDGSLLFEKGHRHELGGHFDQEPYGPPAAPQAAEPGLLQQGAEAVGGALAAGAGGAARFAGGVAQGAAEGLVAQLPAAGDIGAALGGAAVSGIAGAGRLAAGAAGAVGEAVFGGEEEQEAEP